MYVCVSTCVCACTCMSVSLRMQSPYTYAPIRFSFADSRSSRLQNLQPPAPHIPRQQRPRHKVNSPTERNSREARVYNVISKLGKIIRKAYLQGEGDLHISDNWAVKFFVKKCSCPLSVSTLCAEQFPRQGNTLLAIFANNYKNKR